MTFYPTFEEYCKLSAKGKYKNIPVSLTVSDLKKDTLEIFNILKSMSKNVFILESVEDNKKWGRYTFLGFDPKLEITCLNGKVRIKSGTEITFENASPHQYIRHIISENSSPRFEGFPSFTGGLVGYFSYDFIKYSEPSLVLDAKDEEQFNDVDLMLFDKVIVIDNLLDKVIIIANAKTDNIEVNYNKATYDIKNILSIINNTKVYEKEQGKLLEELQPLFSKDKYCEMVEKAKKHIYEGDIFQVVLSNRWSARYEGNLINTYRLLRKNNPSPYMFYLSSDSIEIAGASPETLVKLENGTLYSFPLAGTRPRGKTLEEDLLLEQDLLSDEKECAEHNMLVDLGRNDLGKISHFGSVSVSKYMAIERFSHVMHIGSTVTGKIRDDKDALDAVDEVLPAGTLSGAPKLKACEIINKLENNKRGIYGGAIGYIDFTGNIDTCIAIRLAFKKNGKVFVRSGAGIVADSIPEKEYNECLNKAKAIMLALKEGYDDTAD